MTRLLDDLLDISRIKQNRVSLVRERIDAATAVNAALETTRPLIDAARQQLELSLPAEPVIVDADPTRFAQIISNLLNNASKYTDAGGQISLSVAPVGSNAVIRVRDNGIGIDARHLPGLFDLFSQVDSSRNRGAGGLGIGLALVKSLVEMHGGRVTVASDGIGKGAEFTVHLPLARGMPVAVGRRATDAAMAPAKQSLRVLVVDDNVDSVETLAALLQMIGHDVRSATDAAGALVQLTDIKPQVGIFDIGLPDKDGYELAREVRSTAWGISMRLIALTGWGKDDDKQLAAQAGFDHHLTKPVDLRALEEHLALVQA
jgi:CheY-like chemotaxis protein/two-component sensor histidine kinase